jgi:hypothetical protein
LLQVAESHAFMLAGPLDATKAAGAKPHAPGLPAGMNDTVTAASDAAEPADSEADGQVGAATGVGSGGGGGGSPAGQLSEAALGVLLRLVAHVGCLEALSEPGAVRLLFHTAHCPPSPQALRQALSALQALAGKAIRVAML